MILNIDTATEQASVCIARGGDVLRTIINDQQKDHAAWVQVAISTLLQQEGCTIKDVQAVAVTEGPGSYTGLRVGMATAKGLCYALQIPLITVNTLMVMANGVKMEWLPLDNQSQAVFLCPMIDARRMEVFTAVYNEALQEIIAPQAMVLDAFSYKDALNSYPLLCFGSGCSKWKVISRYPNIQFINGQIDMAKSLAKLATGLHLQQKYADLAYAEPVYLKEFYSQIKI